MGNSKSKINKANKRSNEVLSTASDRPLVSTQHQDKQINNYSKSSDKGTKLDLNLHGYPPINFRKIQKSGFRIGAHVDIGMKDFEAGMTFGKNNIHEIQFSENNNHLKLLKSLENEESTNSNSKEKDKIINTLMSKLAIKDTKQSADETHENPSNTPQ